MSKVLVEVEPTLWTRVRSKALEEGVKVEVIVGRALRGELAGHFGRGSVEGETGGQPQAAERGGPDLVDGAAVETPAAKKTRLQALIDAVPAQRSAVEPASSRPVLEDRRDAERRRVAAQDRLRTHPEDASQDPSDDDSGTGF